MKCSCCPSDEFIRVCLPRRQKCCQKALALFGHLPAIRAGNSGNQPVSVQQGQAPRNFGGLGALLLFVFGLSKQQGPDLAVTKALQSPFASVDRGQQLGVSGVKGVKGSVPTLIAPHRSANFRRLFSQWGSDVCCCQSVQVSLVGRSGKLGSP